MQASRSSFSKTNGARERKVKHDRHNFFCLLIGKTNPKEKMEHDGHDFPPEHDRKKREITTIFGKERKQDLDQSLVNKDQMSAFICTELHERASISCEDMGIK